MTRTIATLMLLAVVSVSLSQEKAENSFTMGIKGGINFNHFLGDIPIDITPQLKVGFSAGVFGNYMLNDKFSIQPEIIFSRKGSNFKEFDFNYEGYEISGLGLDMYIESNWIEIPLLAIYHINDCFSLFGGPYIGFYIDGKVFAELTTEPWVSIWVVNMDLGYDIEADDLNLPDYGIVLGIKYNLTNKLAFQGRWEYGIQDLSGELVNFFEDDEVSMNNSSFQLLVDFTI